MLQLTAARSNRCQSVSSKVNLLGSDCRVRSPIPIGLLESSLSRFRLFEPSVPIRSNWSSRCRLGWSCRVEPKRFGRVLGRPGRVGLKLVGEASFIQGRVQLFAAMEMVPIERFHMFIHSLNWNSRKVSRFAEGKYFHQKNSLFP